MVNGLPTAVTDSLTGVTDLLTAVKNLPTAVSDAPTEVSDPATEVSDAATNVDGSPTTVEQYSKDVTAFLMWAAEPHLEARKRIGFQAMIFLLVFAGLMYFAKKKVWSAVH